MAAWLIPLLGAAAGAMMNRKNPLKGALMGAAAGYMGGAALGAGATGTAIPGLLGGTPLVGGTIAPTGVAGLLGTVKEYAQPAMNIMGAANSAKSLMAEEPPPPPPQITPPTPSNNLIELAQQGQNLDMQREQAEMQRRIEQRKRIQEMGRI